LLLKLFLMKTFLIKEVVFVLDKICEVCIFKFLFFFWLFIVENLVTLRILCVVQLFNLGFWGLAIHFAQIMIFEEKISVFFWTQWCSRRNKQFLWRVGAVYTFLWDFRLICSLRFWVIWAILRIFLEFTSNKRVSQ